MTPPPQKSTLFPYTTLFRSISDDGPIAREDTAPGGYSPRHVSESREGILRTILERDHPEVSVVTASARSEEHTSELQSRGQLVCRLLLEKKKVKTRNKHITS